VKLQHFCVAIDLTRLRLGVVLLSPLDAGGRLQCSPGLTIIVEKEFGAGASDVTAAFRLSDASIIQRYALVLQQRNRPTGRKKKGQPFRREERCLALLFWGGGGTALGEVLELRSARSIHLTELTAGNSS